MKRKVNNMLKILLILMHFIINTYPRPQGAKFALRITKIEDCPVEDKKGEIVEAIITPYNLQHYVSMTVRIMEDFRVGKVTMRFNRCLMDDYSCEYFQSWNFDNICPIAFMKNQMWSPIIEKIKPKLGCPNIKKGLYKTENATIDVNKALKFYPEGAKYKWDFNFTAYNSRKKTVYCLHFVGHLVQFTNKHQST